MSSAYSSVIFRRFKREVFGKPRENHIRSCDDKWQDFIEIVNDYVSACEYFETIENVAFNVCKYSSRYNSEFDQLYRLYDGSYYTDKGKFSEYLSPELYTLRDVMMLIETTGCVCIGVIVFMLGYLKGLNLSINFLSGDLGKVKYIPFYCCGLDDVNKFAEDISSIIPKINKLLLSLFREKGFKLNTLWVKTVSCVKEIEFQKEKITSQV